MVENDRATTAAAADPRRGHQPGGTRSNELGLFLVRGARGAASREGHCLAAPWPRAGMSPSRRECGARRLLLRATSIVLAGHRLRPKRDRAASPRCPGRPAPARQTPALERACPQRPPATKPRSDSSAPLASLPPVDPRRHSRARHARHGTVMGLRCRIQQLAALLHHPPPCQAEVKEGLTGERTRAAERLLLHPATAIRSPTQGEPEPHRPWLPREPRPQRRHQPMAFETRGYRQPYPLLPCRYQAHATGGTRRRSNGLRRLRRG
jgi:hypothetical protein